VDAGFLELVRLGIRRWGGLISGYAAFQRPDVFGSVLGQSSAF